MHTSDELKNFQPTKEFFIGIDSDGCVFDTMEIKQKECFCPNLIRNFGLQRISKYARETWEFVNLYSKTRGVNRFHAVVKTFELLSNRPEIADREMKLMDISELKKWTEQETKLANNTLEIYSKTASDLAINAALNWSLEVNKCIELTVKDIPPFPFVKKSLESIAKRANAMVVSSTPMEALEREWQEHSVDRYVDMIAGQEHGSKKEHLKFAAVGKFSKEKILMIGDAPGDLNAAKSNDVLFYPIVAGEEEISWEKFYNEAMHKFFEGSYSGSYEKKLIEEFEARLPEKPNWKTI